jgi:hypothetical protein
LRSKCFDFWIKKEPLTAKYAENPAEFAEKFKLRHYRISQKPLEVVAMKSGGASTQFCFAIMKCCLIVRFITSAEVVELADTPS